MSLESDGAVIRWEPDTESLSSVVGFELSWSPLTPGVGKLPVTLSSDERTYKIRGAKAKTRYEIEIVAIYTDGYRVVAETQMLFDVPRTPDMRLEIVSETQVTIAWDAPIKDDGVIKRPVSHYEVSWQLEGSSDAVEIRRLDSDASTFTVERLEPGSTYTFTLRAGNGFGFGEAIIRSIETPQSTSAATPSPTPTPTSTPTPNTRPLSVSFMGLRDGDAVVSWRVDANLTSAVERFELSWSPPTDANLTMPVVLTPTTREYRIAGVKAKVRYEIALEMVITDGQSLSDAVEVLLDVPLPPTVQVDALSETDILITWTERRDSANVVQRPVEKYEIYWELVGADSDPLFVVLDADEQSMELKDLVPGATYEIAVRALNVFGASEATILTHEVPLPRPEPEPTLTTTPSATQATTAPNAPARESSARRSRTRVGDPDPPEEFHAVQGRDAVRVFWDQPRYDGGTEVLAYAVDWMPEPPPFPIFVPSDDESLGVYGLRAGVKYRIRVKAFNRIDDSMAAVQKIAMDNSLVRFRDYDPFTGSIANGRSTTLRNDDALSGFELHADADSLFWGDHMKLEVRRYDRYESMAGYEGLAESVLTSDVFGVKPDIESRRRRFDSSTATYELVEPMRVCIATIGAPRDQTFAYSIGQVAQDGNFIVLDSTSNTEEALIKTCARVRTLNLNRETRYAVVAVPYDETRGKMDKSATESRAAANNPMVLMLLVSGHALILFGIRLTRRDRIADH